MQFVKNQEPKPGGVFPNDLIRLQESRHGQFEHDVVVSRMSGGLLAIRSRSSCDSWPVAGEGHRLLAVSVPEPQILLQLLESAVAQRVHRMNDDGRDAFAGVAGLFPAKHVVHYGDEITEGLAGSRTRRQHITLTAPGNVDSVGLMSVQAQAFAESVVSVLDPKNLLAIPVKSPVLNEILDIPAPHEIGIQLDQRSGPESASGVGVMDSLTNVFRSEGRKASKEAFVIRNKRLANPANRGGGPSFQRLPPDPHHPSLARPGGGSPLTWRGAGSTITTPRWLYPLRGPLLEMVAEMGRRHRLRSRSGCGAPVPKEVTEGRPSSRRDLRVLWDYLNTHDAPPWADLDLLDTRS